LITKLIRNQEQRNHLKGNPLKKEQIKRKEPGTKNTTQQDGGGKGRGGVNLSFRGNGVFVEMGERERRVGKGSKIDFIT